MKKKSSNVSRHAAPDASMAAMAASLDRLRAGSKGAANPDLLRRMAAATAKAPVPVDAHAKPLGGRIRMAVINEMKRRDLSPHRLWKLARPHCETLPGSAVYEFLRGTRSIGLEYVEAILAALNLKFQEPQIIPRKVAAAEASERIPNKIRAHASRRRTAGRAGSGQT
jgi:hypothetical protein